MQAESTTIRPLLLMCALGVGLRLAFLLLTGDLELQADEANYVYLALSWNRFGFYSDTGRYLWPPGYPLVLAQAIELLGMGGLFATKLLQVLASASIGLSTMLFARRLFGARAALIAGTLWCLYLPLIGYTHLLWNETLFLALLLPAMLHVLIVMQAGEAARDRNIVWAGVLFAGALYFKEMPLFYAPVLALLLVGFGSGLPLREGVRRASLLLLTIAACVMPWTLRNVEVYDRFVPVGTSLGENLYSGLNAPYKNFDMVPFTRAQGEREALTIPFRASFATPPSGEAWLRDETILNIPDRISASTSRGLAFARNNISWLLITRVQKLADLITPTSFFLRHMGLGNYDDCSLARPGLRQALVAWAVLCPILILLLAVPGFWLALTDRSAFWLIGSFGLYILACSLLVSMSRFRLPLMPFAIVLAAGVLDGARRTGGVQARTILTLAMLVIMGFLWWVAWPQSATFVRLAWGAGA